MVQHEIVGDDMQAVVITLAAGDESYPGKIRRFPLQGSSILCQRDAFLCASGDIDINIAFTRRLGAGFFGGEGFILQRLEGTDLIGGDR